jgi:hypothetical protein
MGGGIKRVIYFLYLLVLGGFEAVGRVLLGVLYGLIVIFIIVHFAVAGHLDQFTKWFRVIPPCSLGPLPVTA